MNRYAGYEPLDVDLRPRNSALELDLALKALDLKMALRIATIVARAKPHAAH